MIANEETESVQCWMFCWFWGQHTKLIANQILDRTSINVGSYNCNLLILVSKVVGILKRMNGE
jgi:hypothetical protein